MMQLCEDFALPATVYDRLYPYQREGVQWMWNVYKGINGVRGGILGDDMGLGKTFQVTSFLAGLTAAKPAMTALVVVPKSLIATWEEHVASYMPETTTVCTFHGTMTSKKEVAMRSLIDKGAGVCITTYGALNSKAWRHEYQAEKIHWSVVVMDEANKVKNPSGAVDVCYAVRQIIADAKLLLTGTPIQNNLEELWALFDIACAGKLFGTRFEFNHRFVVPINAGQNRKADKLQVTRAKETTQALRDAFQPHFLRRDKTTMQALMKASGTDMPLGSIGNMPQKHEVVIWTKLTEVQLHAYKAFLESDQVKEMLNSEQSPLVAINVLRKICAHSLLLNANARMAIADAVSGDDDDEQERLAALKDGQFSTVEEMQADAERLTAMSCKMQFLLQLMHSFKEEGHRVLVFSQSVMMLDIVEAILRHHGLTYSRLDGRVTNPKKRHAIVQDFNADATKLVCLLTKGVGATGLTLTGADRVVILDPSWNPAEDAQAVDRAYRIGQTRPVITYRLVTCGTIEEAIYRRQVFKCGLTNSVMRNDKAGKGERYMADTDLKNCFVIGDTNRSETKSILESVSASSASSAAASEPHLLALEQQAATSECYAGVSYHHKLFKPAAATSTRRSITLPVDETIPRATRRKSKKAKASGVAGSDWLAAFQDAVRTDAAAAFLERRKERRQEQCGAASASRCPSPLFHKRLQEVREAIEANREKNRQYAELRERERAERALEIQRCHAELRERESAERASPGSRSPSPSSSSSSEVIVIDDSDDDDEPECSPSPMKRQRSSSLSEHVHPSFVIDLSSDCAV